MNSRASRKSAATQSCLNHNGLSNYRYLVPSCSANEQQYHIQQSDAFPGANLNFQGSPSGPITVEMKQLVHIYLGIYYNL